MRKLKVLKVGDQFRIARAEELSMARQTVSRSQVLEVVKVYAQTPNAVVSRDVAGVPTTYSFLPDLPILDPDEPTPTDKEINEFVGHVPMQNVVGYELFWDGKTDVSNMIGPACRRLMEHWYASGRLVIGSRELNRLVAEYPDEDWPYRSRPSAAFPSCRSNMLRCRLIREIRGRLVT